MQPEEIRTETTIGPPPGVGDLSNNDEEQRQSLAGDKSLASFSCFKKRGFRVHREPADMLSAGNGCE